MKKQLGSCLALVAAVTLLGSTAPSTAPRTPLNWGLGSTSNSFGIDVFGAWKVTRGHQKVVVAIIDTGVDYTNPDIAPNLWRNPGESGFDAQGRPKRANGVDDDKDGFVDNEIGWDFVDNDNKPYDSHGHGTHIAGIIGGAGVRQISGVSPDVSLMILKYYNPAASGETNLQNTVKAIRYAVAHHANIINYSAGGPSFSVEEYQAIKEARDKGILFIAAAGNEHQNADVFKYYPASYGLDNIISVTAIDADGKILPSSNFGAKTVHIAAPGKNIISSIPSAGMGPMTGTSQATAFVSGLAALALAASDFKLNYRDVKNLILQNGISTPSLAGVTVTGKRVNAAQTLNAVSNFMAGKTTVPAKTEPVIVKSSTSRPQKPAI
jgi:subtilisin family serine protease